MSLSILWFRRDLRLQDNTALHFATQNNNRVVPVYILSDWNESHSWTGNKRQHFLCKCLASLHRSLENKGSRLIIRKGNAIDELKKLILESGATAIYFNRDPDPFGKQTEIKLAQLCAQMSVKYHAHDDVSLHTPDQVLTQAGQPYKVYTPYSRNWLTLHKESAHSTPSQIYSPHLIQSLPLPRVEDWKLEPVTAELPEASEEAAHLRMNHALKEIVFKYADQRDLPAREGTSRISQDLRFGLISIRTLYHQLLEVKKSIIPSAQESIDIYIKELAWREFYFAILHHFPHVLEHEFNTDWKGLPWEEPGENFERWKEGRTGFPIVDAGMRQLLATGFMHNRVRMITAMFLTKDLHHDWKLGESHFMKHLLDGEIASNNGGWQWSAGTGADAAPYFRIQNPWAQTAKHDAEGLYIKKWIPELRHTDPKRFLAEPKDMRPIAAGYPLPCVDHKTERDRTLEIFKKHRAQ